VLLSTATAHAATPAERCLATKITRAGQYHACRSKVDAAAVLDGTSPDFAKCDRRFAGAWADAEAKARVACPTTGDASAIGARVTGDVEDVIAALSPSHCILHGCKLQNARPGSGRPTGPGGTAP